jgi:hypothetical protein
MITRRSLLLGGLAVFGIAGVGLFGFGRAGLESEIVAILRRRLGYLKLDEDGLRAYAKDQTGVFLAKRPSLSRLRYHFISAVGPSFKRFQRSTDTRSRLERMEDQFVSTFLISSDFFFNGSDESRVVRYKYFYDPLVHPCGSPFARPLSGDPA